MKRTLLNNRVVIFQAVVLSLIVSVIIGIQLTAADEVLKWRKLDAMDTNFNIIENKAGDDDILLEMDVEEAGAYNLTYYLENGRQTSIDFIQSYDEMSIEYHVFEKDGIGNITDETQTLVSSSYLEMNYDQTVPDWEYNVNQLVGVSHGLEYVIPRSTSLKYPGVAFEVDNKQLLINWDFQEERLFVVIKDYQYGQIMPVIFNTPSHGSEALKILKQLEDFDVTPTHYMTTDGIVNLQVSPVELPSDTIDRPGNKPGLDVTFKQPKELNSGTWQYDYDSVDMDDITAIFELDDLGTDAYLDFGFKLQNDSDLMIENIDTVSGGVNEGVTYVYDDATHEYTLHIVKDKGNLAQQTTFIEWPELSSSSIYDVNVGFEVALNSTRFDHYEFINFKPMNKLAYTYMAYDLKRANVEEAFLDITPFNAGEREEIEYTILYSKIIKNTLDVDEDLWLKHYHTTVDEDDEIYIPVPFRSTSSQDAYQIVVNFAGVDIYSQVLNYIAVDDDDVPPTTPNIHQLENLFVVPSIDQETTEPERVKFDIAWSAPRNKSIKELDAIFEDQDGWPNDYLYYELSVNDVPTDESVNPFETIKVFQVTKVAGAYEIELVDPLPGNEVGSNTLNYIKGYNDTDELFRVDDVTAREGDRWSNVLATTIDEDTNTYTVADTGTEVAIKFPGINYMRIKAITIKDGEIANSSLSVPISLSLSMGIHEVPIVDTMSYTPLFDSESGRSAGITLTWHSVAISNYENYMLSPIDKKIDAMKYTVYIAEDKESLLPLNDNDDSYREIVSANDHLVIVGDTDATELEHLRDGGVLYVDRLTNTGYNNDLTLNIQGLESNLDYYIRIVTKIDADDLHDLGNPIIEKRSEPSTVLSVRIPRTPEAPNDQEIIPLAPEMFAVEFADESLSNALLTWTMPEEMHFEDDVNGFEVIALEDRSLPEALSDNTFSLTEVLEDEALQSDVVEGWRIYRHNGTTYLKKYDSQTNTYLDLDMSLYSRQGNVFTIMDNANAPNKVHYYYVRTIKTMDEETASASQWVAGSLTTAPVKEPINLIVDYDTEYAYAPKEEVIVRFDAPLSDISQIDSDFVIEVHVKGEMDDDYSVSRYPSRYLGTDGDILAGYQRISYRISELIPGKSYDIKVRIQDRTKLKEVLPDGSTDYPTSPFSDRVRTRTDFDQASYDKENKYNQTIEYYLTRAEALKQAAYFVVTDSKNETAVKYRENYATGLIQMESDGELRLFSEDKSTNTYYIPSGALKLINDKDVTLIVESRNQLVGIRPDTVGIRLTDEVNDMLEDIERTASSNHDYYLRIKVYTSTYSGLINGKAPSSDMVEVSFAILGSELLEEEMDDRMLALLDDVIQTHKKSVVADIEEDLEDGIDEADLLDIVEEVVQEVKEDYADRASEMFKGYLSGDKKYVYSVSNPIYFRLTAEDLTRSHDVYSKVAGQWQYTTSNYFDNRYFVEANVFDPYLTVAKGSGDNNLTELYGQGIVDVVNAYDLSTVFSSYDLSKTEATLYKYRWLNAVARLMGAGLDEDAGKYLIEKGIDVTNDDLYTPLNNDEALYIFAKAYAYRHNIVLTHTYISDYYRISDLDNADEAYRLTLLQGANLGIIDTDNGYISPEGHLTMGKAMTLLTRLHQGIN